MAVLSNGGTASRRGDGSAVTQPSASASGTDRAGAARGEADAARASASGITAETYDLGEAWARRAPSRKGLELGAEVGAVEGDLDDVSR